MLRQTCIDKIATQEWVVVNFLFQCSKYSGMLLYTMYTVALTTWSTEKIPNVLIT